MHPMEGVFSLSEAARSSFIRSLVQSFGCAYICLWSYDSTSPNRLFFLDGFYNIRNNQVSSSLGSVAQQIFNQYRTLAFEVNDDRVPGLAFRNNRPYIELQQPDLLRLAWTEIQKRFFQEARIKTAVFMGCNKGEIELGFLNMSQAELQTALRSLFPEDFSRQAQQIDQNNPPSSSSSSLRSLSTGSPEYSSLLFSIPGTSQFPDQTLGGVPTMAPVSTTATSIHQQQAIQLQQALAQTTTTPPSQIFPTQEIENDALMRAILNAISQPPMNVSVVHPETSAFKRFRTDISSSNPNIGSSQMGSNFRRQSMLKRSFAFFRSLNFMRMRERIQATRPTSTQLHHMISERRRREKINENFQALRALLPPGTKKDKASILTTAKETLSSLMSEIENLSKRNQELTSLLPPSSKESSTTEKTKATIMIFPSSNERFHVRISEVAQSSSSSEERMVDLQVAMRGQVSQVDALIRLLEFLKQDQNLSLVSIDANTTTHAAEGNNTVNQLNFRLRIIEGSEWDESAFEEAVRRVVDDLVQFQPS